MYEVRWRSDGTFRKTEKGIRRIHCLGNIHGLVDCGTNFVGSRTQSALPRATAADFLLFFQCTTCTDSEYSGSLRTSQRYVESRPRTNCDWHRRILSQCGGCSCASRHWNTIDEVIVDGASAEELYGLKSASETFGISPQPWPDVHPHARCNWKGGGVPAAGQRSQWASDIPRTNIPEQSSGVVVMSAAA